LKRLCFALLMVSMGLSHFMTAALGQEPQPDGEVVASYPMFTSGQISPIRITMIDAGKGTAILSVTGQSVLFANIPRGEIFLLTQDEQTREMRLMIRANLDEILENNEVVVKIGKEALKVVRPGPVIPIHPINGSFNFQSQNVSPVPSRKFRLLPEVVSFGETTKGNDGNQKNNAISAARLAAMRAQSTNNLKQIALALHNFADANGHLPPAVIYGPDGKPWHSWRTLILPYLEQADLYNKYDFTKPWDAPANKAVVETVVEVYKDPVYGKSKEAIAHYGAMVGKQAAFLPDGAIVTDQGSPLGDMAKGGRKFAAFTDGTSISIMVAPIADERKVPWAKPEDIVFGDPFPAPGKPGGLGMPYESGDGKFRFGPVAFVDGSVRSINSNIDPALLRELITINGGEVIDFNKIQDPAPARPAFPIFKLIRKPDGSYSAIID